MNQDTQNKTQSVKSQGIVGKAIKLLEIIHETSMPARILA